MDKKAKIKKQHKKFQEKNEVDILNQIYTVEILADDSPTEKERGKDITK